MGSSHTTTKEEKKLKPGATSLLTVRVLVQKKNRDRALLVIPGTISLGICPVSGQYVKIQEFGKRSTKDDCLQQHCTYTSVPEHSLGAEEGTGKSPVSWLTWS